MKRTSTSTDLEAFATLLNTRGIDDALASKQEVDHVTPFFKNCGDDVLFVLFNNMHPCNLIVLQVSIYTLSSFL
jgi:hypothetical protein